MSQICHNNYLPYAHQQDYLLLYIKGLNIDNSINLMRLDENAEEFDCQQHCVN